MNDSLPTPLTDAALANIRESGCMDNCDSFGHDELCPYVNPENVLATFTRGLERDCMTLALRMYAMDMNAPETNEVLERWRPRVEALLQNQMIDNATLATVPR